MRSNTHENDTQAELAAWEILAETRAKLDTVTEQRDKLAEALNRILPFVDPILANERYNDAVKALQSLTKPEQ